MPLDSQKRPFGVLHGFNGAVRSPLQWTESTAGTANRLMVCAVDNTVFSTERLQWTCSGADFVQAIYSIHTVVAGNVLKERSTQEYIDDL